MLLEKIRKESTSLGQYVDHKIYYGIKTGLKKAFVIDEETRDALIVQDESSRDFIKPFLAGRDIRRYQQLWANQYLILISSGWTDEQTDEENKWEWFSSEYPAIAEHLAQYQNKARKRYDQGKYWWELRPCDYYIEFKKPKIVYAEIATRGQFTLDEDNNYLDTTGFILGSASKALLGILNSKVWTFLFSTISSEIRGGFFRWKRQYLESMPLPVSFGENNKQIKFLVNQILTAKRDDPDADTCALEAEIDRLVYDLYGLSEEDIGIVEESVG